MKTHIHRAAALYRAYEHLLNRSQDALLLGIRLIWGIPLLQTGWGKFHDLAKVGAFFQEIGIPFPQWNAPLVAGVELVCGLFLALGLLGRIAPVPVIATLVVAYATSEQEALLALVSGNPDPFFAAAPFLFLFAAVILWIFGPGRISLDSVAGRVFRKIIFDLRGIKPFDPDHTY